MKLLIQKNKSKNYFNKKKFLNIRKIINYKKYLILKKNIIYYIKKNKNKII